MQNRLVSMQQRADQDAAAGAQEQVVEGFLTVNGVGEMEIQVNFPVTFTEKPAMLFGGERSPDQAALQLGNYPVMTATAGEFRVVEKGIFKYYTGVKVIVVVTGSGGQLVVHWRAAGTALRNPSGL